MDDTRSAKEHFAGVQGLRGVAALLVVLHHAGILLAKEKYFSYTVLGGSTGLGYRGVDLFFVISGFVMGAYVFSTRSKPAAAFAVARIRRIFVPYLPVFLGLSVAILIAPGIFPAAYQSADFHFWQNLILAPRANLDTYVPVVAWSLSHELFFYLMTAALLFVPLGRPLFIVWLTATAGFVVLGPTMEFPATFLLSRYNLAFGLGIAAYFAVSRLSRTGHFATVGFLLLAAGVAAEVHQGYGEPSLLIDSLYFVGFAGVIAGLARRKLKALTLVGDFSYSLYLVHYPVLVACVLVYLHTVGSSFPLAAFVLVSIAAVGAGYIYFRMVESPALKLSSRGRVARPKRVPAEDE